MRLVLAVNVSPTWYHLDSRRCTELHGTTMEEDGMSRVSRSVRSLSRLMSSGCTPPGGSAVEAPTPRVEPALPARGPVPRQELVAAFAATKPLLEIGPFDSPMMTGAGVKYFDVIDQQAMSERQLEHPLHTGVPPVIDFVSPNGDLSIVDETFLAVASSHCIEHQPDLVSHLQGVGRILEDGGYYLLAIPDKRYCFDHFSPETSIADVIQAHSEERTIHSVGSVVRTLAMATHNDSTRHWSGDHEDPLWREQLAERVGGAMQAFDDAEGAYIDVHAWYFTPRSFEVIVQVLHSMGLSPLHVSHIYETPHPTLEFMAVLQKS